MLPQKFKKSAKKKADILLHAAAKSDSQMLNRHYRSCTLVSPPDYSHKVKSSEVRGENQT